MLSVWWREGRVGGRTPIALKKTTANGNDVFFTASAAANALYEPAVEKISVETAVAMITDPTRLPHVERVQLRASSSVFSLPDGLCMRTYEHTVRTSVVVAVGGGGGGGWGYQ